MPDFTEYTAPMCAQNHLWVRMVPSSDGTTEYEVRYCEQYEPWAMYKYDYDCSCPAYTHRKAKKGNREYCKHILAVRQERCTWNAHMEHYPVPSDKRCPECGGPLVYERVAA